MSGMGGRRERREGGREGQVPVLAVHLFQLGKIDLVALRQESVEPLRSVMEGEGGCREG